MLRPSLLTHTRTRTHTRARTHAHARTHTHAHAHAHALACCPYRWPLGVSPRPLPPHTPSEKLVSGSVLGRSWTRQPLMPGPGVILGQGGASISFPPPPCVHQLHQPPCPACHVPSHPHCRGRVWLQKQENRKSEVEQHRRPRNEVIGPRPHDLSGSEPGFKPPRLGNPTTRLTATPPSPPIHQPPCHPSPWRHALPLVTSPSTPGFIPVASHTVAAAPGRRAQAARGTPVPPAPPSPGP